MWVIPKNLECFSWFSGYGGNELGLRLAGVRTRTVAYCEREGYACANLVSKMEAGLMDAAPIWTDCKTFPCESFRGLVDLFTASYPCQGFSAAGQRKGEEDPRYLWPWVRRAVSIIRPERVFFENVEGHVSLGLREVLTDLVDIGYRVENSRGEPTWGIFSASEVGAPHQRKRVFILGERVENPSRILRAGGERELRRGWGICEASASGGSELADADEPGSQGRISGELRECAGELPARANGPFARGQWPSRPGEPQHEWEAPRVIEPGLGGAVDGHTTRVDRLRLCGNGVVPATAARAWTILSRRLEQ